MIEETIDEQSDDFVRDVCCLDCLDLADVSRLLNRAIKDDDLKSESFWFSAVTNISNRLLCACNELEIRRIKAMREELKKDEQIEPDVVVKKKNVDKRMRMNLYEEYDYHCRFLFRQLLNMGDFNDAKEETMFTDAKRDWEDLVKVREKLKNKINSDEEQRRRNVKNTA